MSRPRAGIVVAIVAVTTMASCSNGDVVESPAPGGTEVDDDETVRAPNGTNMGAPPVNVEGTPTPGS